MRSQCVFVALFLAQTLPAQRVGVPTSDLDKISVDELFSVQVTSVGKKAQQLSKAPAAVFVLTADDIRRSGATSIPEALQWVPGLTVLKLDGRNWVVSARGGARLYANKMLVLIDGRSLYTPLFAGVVWDAIDVPLENIQQIEVVRGPGAVMWGPNAVNGVINIITRPVGATKGGLVSAAAGNELRGSTTARWAPSLDDQTALRVWGKAEARAPAFSSAGVFIPANRFPYRDPRIDDLDTSTARFGVRLERNISEHDTLLLQGDVYKMGRQDPVADTKVVPDIVERSQGHSDYEGGFVQALWRHKKSDGDESSWQFSFDKSSISYPFFGADQNNLVMDYQRRRQTGSRNEIYWGAGFEQYWDNTYSNQTISFKPYDSIYRAGDVVARDEFQIVPGRLLASAGMRVDYNSYSHFEFQPSVRLLYMPDTTQSAWVAWSRAVRVPSRYDRDIQSSDGIEIMQGLPIHTAMVGSHTMRSEVESTAEIGYRFQSGQRWSIDASVFRSGYSRLRAPRLPDQPLIDFSGPMPQFWAYVPETNAGSGLSYGGELWATWQVKSRWRLIPSYSYLDESLLLPDSSYVWDGNVASIRHQALLRSQHDLSRHWQLDIMLRARSRNPQFQLPGAFLADIRLGWRTASAGELSFAVLDLTNRRCLETLSEGPFVAIPLRRTILLKWTRQF